ncbi:Muskelin-N domain-containing protein [Mycena indigotica]|uniref:Muskelin-N domain-containing protein n=1 Tax=Mycena indigotica TaxID=2126181 RepID=A0A8H6TC13_9AGAR|nr:Muskelin-N domain-containing protein [Mycena indigotica]KAF7315763.1 Muskelin-N domain-containing protein [Mycena indigotica]
MATVPLAYTVAASTPHSGPYRAENILVDNPQEQASRWSGGPPESGLAQWLLLRLESLAVVYTLNSNPSAHPCNMKDFKVLVGSSEDTLTEVLHSQLKNDANAETFDLRHVNLEGTLTPCRFLKIMPLSSHGNSFHVSVWHVALKGIKDDVFVEQVRLKYEQSRETSAMRYVLKHLRQHRFLTPYNAILSRCGLQVEHPLVTELHANLVLKGDWAKAEEVLGRISQTDLFDEYRNSNQCRAVWNRLMGTDPNGDRPSERGGHAMCIDPVEDVVYLFGGWNGSTSLDDFWAYDIKADKWRVLSYSTSRERVPNAPNARSCHKMVFDVKTGAIYMLGRLNDADAQAISSATAPVPTDPPRPVPGCELYRYHTRGPLAEQWEFLSPDPPVDITRGSPPLVYDHQMAMDSEAQVLYMYGGRVIDNDWANTKYAGLYSYNVATAQWQLLQNDPKLTTAFSGTIIPARHGHAMVLDEQTHMLYIFGGRMKDTSHFDMYSYDLTTKSTRQLFSDLQRDYGHEASFTVRGVIDPKLQEIYVFSGLDPDDLKIPTTSPNRVFRYNPPPGKWDLIPTVTTSNGVALEEPVPRFAHQVVYHPTTRTIYLHGGNGGLKAGNDSATPEEIDRDRRLDDFWQMSLTRMSPEEIVRRATMQVRKQQFREMCEDGSHAKALRFLRNNVLPVVDQHDAEENADYRRLMAYLVTPPSPVISTTHPHLKTPLATSEHEDSPPKKRSRPNTPEDSEMTTEPVLEPPAPVAKMLPFDVQLVKDSDDPEETKNGAIAVSTARFQQRNLLFEALLGFISEDAKQPTGSLVNALDNLMI